MSYPRFVNSPRTFIADALRGAAAAADDLVWRPDPGYLTRREPVADGRVAVLSGGGSGHEPMHAGFIGAGMLAGACPGLVFTSPNALQIAAATGAVDAGGGVLHVVKNYTGDVMNFAIAADLAGEAGIAVERVLVDDDVATDRGDADGPGRRGTAATIAVEKICGAAAERGDGLAAVAALGRRVAENARSMSVALRPCTVPGAERPSFDLPEGQIELGIGIHGERGTARVAAMPAAQLVPELAGPVVDALTLSAGDDVIAIVNGLGATHALELQVVFGELLKHLRDRHIRVVRHLVGTFVTAFDMAGASITLIRADGELVELWDAPTAAPAWPNAPAREVAELPREPADRPVSPGARHARLPHDPLDRAVAVGTARWVRRVLDAVPELTDLDRRAGDGDFGNNMAAALEGFEPSGGAAEVLKELSDRYFVRAGGTSGALLGTWFRYWHREFANESAEPAHAARAAMEKIEELGGARPGDKTMVDAIAPAVDAMDQTRGRPFLEVLQAAARAARDGAESTASMTAARGRSSYVGEAARGVADPGAVVMAWFFEELAVAAD